MFKKIIIKESWLKRLRFEKVEAEIEKLNKLSKDLPTNITELNELIYAEAKLISN